MPESRQDKVLVACPHCGHEQAEPPSAFSTVCKKCRQNYRVQEALHPVKKAPPTGPQLRRVTCFECGAELEVPISAQSTMCKRCSRYVDLNDYHITSAVSKNFKTKGTFIIEPAGYVLNSEALVAEAVIKGRFLGKLVVERSLTIHSTAEIKGSFKAAKLVIPAGNRFGWREPIHAGAADISGELVADLHTVETIVLRATARFFGDLEAKNLVVEEGAVLVGRINVGARTP
jgi:cytoskeletal protein CcmA (bactofilin family)/DNA-directed RNA polymerase subunit RPC12/RpoP